MTIHCEDLNLVFIHIPKTAGYSISEWLEEYAGGESVQYPIYAHHKLHHMVEAGIVKPDTKVFCVVRNPYDRFVSCWKFEEELGYHKKSFDEWLSPLDPKSIVNDDQVSYIEGDHPVDVLRFEHLENDFRYIQEYVGCDEPLFNLNGSKHDPWMTYYTKQTQDIVENKAHRDFSVLYSK